MSRTINRFCHPPGKLRSPRPEMQLAKASSAEKISERGERELETPFLAQLGSSSIPRLALAGISKNGTGPAVVSTSNFPLGENCSRALAYAADPGSTSNF